jgi:hypothetical protein
VSGQLHSPAGLPPGTQWIWGWVDYTAGMDDVEKNCWPYRDSRPVTVAALSKAWTLFARSDARIVGSNPTQDMIVWCVHAFILCLCCPVFRKRPCDGLITRPGIPTDCVRIITELNKRPGPWMGWKSHWKKNGIRASRYRWQDNIKLEINDLAWYVVNWINL